MLIADGRLPRRSEDRFHMEHVRKRPRSTRTIPQPAERDVLVHAADPTELGGIKLGLIVSHERLHDRGRSPCAKLGPVLGGKIVDVIGRPQRSGPRHVLRHHGRMSWNESPKMSRESTRIGVVSTARAIADFDVDGLPVERLSCRLARGFSPYCNKECQSRKRREPPIAQVQSSQDTCPSSPFRLAYGKSHWSMSSVSR